MAAKIRLGARSGERGDTGLEILRPLRKPRQTGALGVMCSECVFERAPCIPVSLVEGGRYGLSHFRTGSICSSSPDAP